MSKFTLNPIPSLLRASAMDAANAHMRKAGRTAWGREDADCYAETQERLIRTCYASKHPNPDWCFIRYHVAGELERKDMFGLRSDLAEINRLIDHILDAD